MHIKDLKKQKIWVNWKGVPQENGKIKKIPFAYNGGETGCDDAHKETWTTFENVEGKLDGTSFALRNGLCAIDIDSNNYDTPMIKEIIDLMDTYTEYSPSGNGFHILFSVDVSKIPTSNDTEGKKKLDNKYCVKNVSQNIECYIGGLTNRFMTYTEDVFIDKEIEERTEQLLIFLNKYMKKPSQDASVSSEKELEEVAKNVLEIIIHSASVAKFKKLFNEGNTEDYNYDDSSADLALCNILAFYCGNNPQLIDYIFSQSKLYREKWDRKDYKYRTIKKAIENCNGNFYNTGIDLMLLNYFNKNNIHKSYKANDIDISRLFATTYKDKLRYNTTEKEWMFYNSKVWSIDERSMKALALMKTFTITLRQYALQVENEQFSKYVNSLLNVKKRELLLSDSKSYFPVMQGELDAKANLLNLQNGTLNLDTFELQPHDANDLLSKIANVSYMPGSKSERWETFIEEVMEGKQDMINYLQKVFGYSLLASNPMNKFFILYGKTRSGKGTLTGTIYHLLGGVNGYSATIMPKSLALHKDKDGSTASPDIAKLQSCRYLNASEPEQDFKIDTAFLKTATGGDTITTRHLYGKPFDFMPQFTLFINTNYLPTITDPTVFESDRVKVIEFNRHFEENERDTTLKDLFKEPEQLSGILNWLLEGLKEYIKEGLDTPAEVEQATKEYQYTSDKIKLFLDAYMEKGDTNIAVSYVYNCYYGATTELESPFPKISKSTFMQYMRRQPYYSKKGTVNGQTITNVLINMKFKND